MIDETKRKLKTAEKILYNTLLGGLGVLLIAGITSIITGKFGILALLIILYLGLAIIYGYLYHTNKRWRLHQ
jgi:hypothetical protein